ncbi:MAG: hypothetical protein RL693_433, partial [Verrucomicrobiota bacterium]
FTNVPFVGGGTNRFNPVRSEENWGSYNPSEFDIRLQRGEPKVQLLSDYEYTGPRPGR